MGGATGDRNRVCRVVALLATCAVAWSDSAAAAPQLPGPQAAWRGDPRPPADVPEGIEAAGRRSSWRAQRRAARRGRGVTQVEPPPAPEMPEPEPPPATAVVHLVHRDQPYAAEGHPRQRFDIHLPTGCGGGLPLVVWIHGDDWRSGSKADCPITWLVDRGYAVASVGHRLSSDAAFPAQLEDARAGLGAILRDAELWGIDPQRVCVAGFGSGGQLAALVAMTDESTDAADPPTAALVAIAAPTLLTALEPRYDRATAAAAQLVGGPLPEFRETAQRASPVVHASSDDPPTLLLHGRRDADVPPEQSRRLEEALRAAGVECRLELVDATHAVPLSAESAAGRTLSAFLERTLGPGTTGP